MDCTQEAFCPIIICCLEGLGFDYYQPHVCVSISCRYANDGQFKEAIHDFEKALTLNHTHRNARTYLVETQVVYGRE